MTEKSLKVLFLPQIGTDPLWQREVVEAVDSRHDMRIFDVHGSLSEQFSDIDVVIDTGGSVGTRAMLDASPKVQLWQILGTGLDHFDLAYWKARGVMIANCPGPMSAVALAEHALLLMLMLARKVPEAQVNLVAGRLYLPIGVELPGRTLCLIGFGASARELAVRAKAMGMRIVATDLLPVDGQTLALCGVDAVLPPERLDELLPQSDYVSLHLHLNQATKHTLDARRIALMKQGSFIVNVARGALVDEAAMVAAVANGHLGGAGIDVFTEEPPSPDSALLNTPGIITTPHIAGVTDGTARRRAEGAALNVEMISRGLDPLHRVDL